MTTRSDRLAAFLAAGAALPFVWGERDCCLWVADWVKAERGLDPAGEKRGSYATAASCWRMLRRCGGLAALVSGEMLDAGFQETDAPRPGDVGIIETSVGAMMAICTGERWALKSVDGIAILPATPAMAWSI